MPDCCERRRGRVLHRHQAPEDIVDGTGQASRLEDDVHQAVDAFLLRRQRAAGGEGLGQCH
eukprot:13947-Lingulodinium_polyedra.AAC.1